MKSLGKLRYKKKNLIEIHFEKPLSIDNENDLNFENDDAICNPIVDVVLLHKSDFVCFLQVCSKEKYEIRNIRYNTILVALYFSLLFSTT